MGTADEIGRRLVAGGEVSAEELAAALELRERTDAPLADVLIGTTAVTEEPYLRAAAEELDLDYWDHHRVATIDPSPDAVKAVPRGVAIEHVCVPVEFRARSGELLVLVADPLDEEGLSALKIFSGADDLEVAVATGDSIAGVWDIAYRARELTESGLPIRATPAAGRSKVDAGETWDSGAMPAAGPTACPACNRANSAGTERCWSCGSPM